MKTYKVHQVNRVTGKSILLLQTEKEQQARLFYTLENPAPGYSIELSVIFSGSTTLLEWK